MLDKTHDVSRCLLTLWTWLQHWMGPVEQVLAGTVLVEAGAVTVTVVVEPEPQRFSAGAGVAAARTESEARIATVEMRENILILCRGELEVVEVVLVRRLLLFSVLRARYLYKMP
jgi:hypothetical protein